MADDGTAVWRGGTSILQGQADERHPWRLGLPKRWAGMVVVPTYFVRYRDYEILAERFVGYECEDSPCFTECRVNLSQDCNQNGQVSAAGSQCWEHMTAWRLVDGHWLILRRYRTGEDPAQTKEFFCLSESMPR